MYKPLFHFSSRNALILPLILSLFTSLPVIPKAIIFDLGDTLIQQKAGKVASYVGYWNGFWMWLEYGKDTKDRTGALLMKVLSDGTEHKNKTSIRVGQSRAIPRILCDWYMGKVTSAEARAYALKKVQKFRFALKRERAIVEAIINWMFDPQKFAKSWEPIPQGLELLKGIVALKDRHGMQMHQLYIISNYDRESFFNLRDREPELFKFFHPKQSEISALVGDMKPRHSIFENFMKKHKLKREDCIFIDDLEENVHAARRCGMNAIRIIDHDYKPVRYHLQRMGVAVES